MEHPPGVGVGLDDVQAVLVGLPVVDHGGQVQLLGQGELGVEELPLLGPARLVLDPVVVQTDLPDGLHLGVGGQGLDLGQVIQGGSLQVFWVEAHGGVDVGILFGQSHAGPAGGQVAAGAEHQPHPRPGQG